MIELIFLLLPLAFYSGWRSAQRQAQANPLPENPVPARFVRGINFLLNEEPDKALEMLLASPGVEAQNADTLLALGKMFRNRGEVNRALKVHQYLVARADLSTRERQSAMLALGEDFFAAGLLDRAEKVFREFMRHYPKNNQACEPLRQIYEQLHEWQKALDLAACGIENKTTRKQLLTHYLCQQAEIALAAQQLYQVEELLKKAVHLNPISARVQVLHAELALIRDERSLAIQYFKQAIRYDARLTGMLTRRFLEVFDQHSELQSLQSFICDEYRRAQDAHLFPSLLALSQVSGDSDVLLPVLQSHLYQAPVSLQSITRSAEWLADQADKKLAWPEGQTGTQALSIALVRLVKNQPRFQCVHCGYKMQDYLWRCPACHQWDSIQHA